MTTYLLTLTLALFSLAGDGSLAPPEGAVTTCIQRPGSAFMKCQTCVTRNGVTKCGEVFIVPVE